MRGKEDGTKAGLSAINTRCVDKKLWVHTHQILALSTRDAGCLSNKF